MPTRREARDTAFQFVYSSMPKPTTADTKEFAIDRGDFEHFCNNFGYQATDFAWELCHGTGKNLPTIDKKIGALSTNWRIERMPLVDLSILRLATFEILFRTDVPKTVAINEAIELAKRYGAEDSPAFINGILDQLEKGAGAAQ